MIENIADLAEHLYAKQATTESVGNRVYKITESGCPAGVEEDCFWVTGYCEGSDFEHEVYRVRFPCSSEDVDKAIAKADQDGKGTWDATHGCAKCWPEGTCDPWGNEIEPGESGGPINPDCTTCAGNGIIF